MKNKLDSQALSRAKQLVAAINVHLPVNYADLSDAEKDPAFIVAFEKMMMEFLKDKGAKKKIDHSMHYCTLYEKYLTPHNKKRKLDKIVEQEGEDENLEEDV